MEQFKDFQDELWKTSASPRLRPKLNIVNSMSRFNCRFYDKQLLEDYQNKIASLSINYDEDKARELFNEVTALLNEDSDEHYHFCEPQLFYDLIHSTEFSPSKEDFISIIQCYRKSNFDSLEEILESYTDYNTDEILECYAKAVPNYLEYYEHYGYYSNFIPLSEDNKNFFLERLEIESKLQEESKNQQESEEQSTQEENDSNLFKDNSDFDKEFERPSYYDESQYESYSGNYYGYGQE